MQTLAEHRDLLARRLEAEFGSVCADTVRRCIADVQACMAHLGIETTPALVERMAREHLIGVIKSEPPSGGAPLRGGLPARTGWAGRAEGPDGRR
jgi:hypothetical protein